mmetsp:Transcript_36995/g.104437  ORF Transcript_36995/g.104437 Transcript_36995/m.104437 type:complete len:250 (-) Transcript_36995:3447-4196(-)
MEEELPINQPGSGCRPARRGEPGPRQVQPHLLPAAAPATLRVLRSRNRICSGLQPTASHPQNRKGLGPLSLCLLTLCTLPPLKREPPPSRACADPRLPLCLWASVAQVEKVIVVVEGAAAAGAEAAGEAAGGAPQLANVRLPSALRPHGPRGGVGHRAARLAPRFLAHCVPLQPHHREAQLRGGAGRRAGDGGPLSPSSSPSAAAASHPLVVQGLQHDSDGRQGVVREEGGLQRGLGDAVDGVPADGKP